MKRKLTAALLFAVVASLLVVGVVLANDQPVEWADNPNSWRYSLDYMGMGYSNCDWNDYGFELVKSFSADPENYRLNASNGTVASAFDDKSVIGYQLETASDAYICTGFTDTWNAGGPGNVESYLFVWVQ